MAIDILITTSKIASDPIAREFINFIQAQSERLALSEGVVYYDFPTYADYETVRHKPDVLVVSPVYGIAAVKFFDGSLLPLSQSQIEDADESLAQFCSILIGRLIKSKVLRKGLSSLSFDVTPILLYRGASGQAPATEVAQVVQSFEGFASLLTGLEQHPISSDAMAEIRSVVEGAKALTRPQKRTIDQPETQMHAVALSKLEAEIANFDQRQRRAALVSIPGPQRIRGLAGSGKTVILAMKAAHLHLNNPDENILITFYTKSLKSPIQNMISRFYRHYKDEDPDWGKIHVRHGWGGQSVRGVYSDACARNGVSPMSFGMAREKFVDPFDGVCRDLLAKGVRSFYDHVLVDEGQDFPSGFYELCFALAKGGRDSKNIIWAYDELQNILNVKIRSPEELFGKDEDGEPRISLDRAARNLPPGTDNDTVLSKCYRNQREVLLTAHALGFGIYKDIVQLLESKEHWEDVGYRVLKGETFSVGEEVEIERPAENNPISIQTPNGSPIIETRLADSLDGELSWITTEIQKFIAGGLQPEDILVVALDDRHARTYFRSLSGRLAAVGLSTNNLLADPYSEPPFQIPGKLTLSTVYRAKGNEAAVVFAAGVDAANTRTRSGRNKLFTAFTRSKAWLRVSGMGQPATAINAEIATATKHFPMLEFTMPDLAKVEMIQRDLSKRATRTRKARQEIIRSLKEQGFTEEEIEEVLSSTTDKSDESA